MFCSSLKCLHYVHFMIVVNRDSCFILSSMCIYYPHVCIDSSSCSCADKLNDLEDVHQ